MNQMSNLPELTLKDAPTTWPERLREISKLLDLADKMAVLVSIENRLYDPEAELYTPGDAMQQDLLNLADWIETL